MLAFLPAYANIHTHLQNIYAHMFFIAVARLPSQRTQRQPCPLRCVPLQRPLWHLFSQRQLLLRLPLPRLLLRCLLHFQRLPCLLYLQEL